jgi:hypothetical protein
MNNKILEIAQKYGDLAFLQGYEAALQGIPKEDRAKLIQMPEALKRLNEFNKLYFNLTKSKKHGNY